MERQEVCRQRPESASEGQEIDTPAARRDGPDRTVGAQPVENEFRSGTVTRGRVAPTSLLGLDERHRDQHGEVLLRDRPRTDALIHEPLLGQGADDVRTRNDGGSVPLAERFTVGARPQLHDQPTGRVEREVCARRDEVVVVLDQDRPCDRQDVGCEPPRLGDVPPDHVERPETLPQRRVVRQPARDRPLLAEGAAAGSRVGDHDPVLVRCPHSRALRHRQRRLEGRETIVQDTDPGQVRDHAGLQAVDGCLRRGRHGAGAHVHHEALGRLGTQRAVQKTGAPGVNRVGGQLEQAVQVRAVGIEGPLGRVLERALDVGHPQRVVQRHPARADDETLQQRPLTRMQAYPGSRRAAGQHHDRRQDDHTSHTEPSSGTSTPWKPSSSSDPASANAWSSSPCTT